jgi:hypothetical protein
MFLLFVRWFAADWQSDPVAMDARTPQDGARIVRRKAGRSQGRRPVMTIFLVRIARDLLIRPNSIMFSAAGSNRTVASARGPGGSAVTRPLRTIMVTGVV